MRLFVLVFSAASVVCGASSFAATRPARPPDPVQFAARIENADEAFIAAREAFRAGDLPRATVLAQRVTALEPRHPLAAYLDYWSLSRQIRDYGDAQTAAAPDDAIRAFIARNPGSVVADLARRDWLLALGKRGEWTTFEAEMPKFALNDDAQVTCFQLTARAIRQIGRHVAERKVEAHPHDVTCRGATVIPVLPACGPLPTR